MTNSGDEPNERAAEQTPSRGLEPETHQNHSPRDGKCGADQWQDNRNSSRKGQQYKDQQQKDESACGHEAPSICVIARRNSSEAVKQWG